MDSAKTKSRKEEDDGITGPVDWGEIARFVGSLVVFVLGALMVAEGVLKAISGSTLFFPELGASFEFVIGFIVIVIGASLVSMNRSRLFIA